MDRGTAAPCVNLPVAGPARLNWAGPGDGEAISELVAMPLPGTVRITLGELPGHCTPRSSASERHHAVVIRAQDGSVLGHGARTVRRCWLDGRPRWLGYLHGLRRAPALTGDGRRLARALTTLCNERSDDEVYHDFTAILSDNHRARRVLESGLPGAPPYHDLTGYTTVIGDANVARRWKDSRITVRPCEFAMVNNVRALVDDTSPDYARVAVIADALATWWTAWKHDTLVGAVQVINRDQERRAIVAGYAPWLSLLRPVVNLGLRVSRQPSLPAVGSSLGLRYASHLSTADDDVAVVRALLAAVASDPGCQRVVWGLGHHHRLHRQLESLPGWRIHSRIYAVGTQPQRTNRSISPEVAWL